MKLKNKENRQLTQEQTLEMVGRPRTNKPKKEKNVKVTHAVHHRLSKMGTVSQDMGDVVEMLLDYWDEGHK